MTREEFIQNVKCEQGPLRRFLLALCLGNKPEADDIAQEALVKAYLALSSFDNKGKFSSWIYRIAYNTFLDHKKSSRHTKPLEEARGESSPATADSSFEYQELYSALNLLSDKERTSILLFYIKGYSIKEICQIIDASEDAVKKQLSRGRERLKHLLS